MKVSDVAKLTGVTVRTLHYYDEIGLLPPSGVTSSGYRVYNDADLEVLQQILFFRELDFSLEDIRAIMQKPESTSGTKAGQAEPTDRPCGQDLERRTRHELQTV